MPVKLTIALIMEDANMVHRIVSDTMDESEFVNALIEQGHNKISLKGVKTVEDFRDKIGKEFTAKDHSICFNGYGQGPDNNGPWEVTVRISPLNVS
ncbi:hypothetical protein GGI13_001576 [Coemansia sp. RSA 455]|nr:hypothetical protein GGI13_001576 [Coemansia sp. RSA 455]